MRAALKFYQENIGDEYIPVIESGKSFRSKFLKLENAIQRENPRKKRKYSDTGNRMTKEALDSAKKKTIVI